MRCVVPCRALRTVPALYRTRAIEERKVQNVLWRNVGCPYCGTEKNGKDRRRCEVPTPSPEKNFDRGNRHRSGDTGNSTCACSECCLTTSSRARVIASATTNGPGGRLASRIRRARPCLRPSRSLCVAPFLAPELPHCVRPRINMPLLQAFCGEQPRSDDCSGKRLMGVCSRWHPETAGL